MSTRAATEEKRKAPDLATCAPPHARVLPAPPPHVRSTRPHVLPARKEPAPPPHACSVPAPLAPQLPRFCAHSCGEVRLLEKLPERRTWVGAQGGQSSPTASGRAAQLPTGAGVSSYPPSVGTQRCQS